MNLKRAKAIGRTTKRNGRVKKGEGKNNQKEKWIITKGRWKKEERDKWSENKVNFCWRI